MPEVAGRKPAGSGSDYGFKASVLRGARGASGMVIGADLKAALTPGHLALQLPASAYVGDGSFWSGFLHPGLIASLRPHRNLELNLLGRAFIGLRSGVVMGVYTAGLALGRDLDRFAVRPEITWIRGPDSDRSTQFGLGFEFRSPGHGDRGSEPPSGTRRDTYGLPGAR